jgi:guanyl-specific ribonuclease Sa
VKQLTRIIISLLLTIPLMLLTSEVASARTAVSIKDLTSAHVAASTATLARPTNSVVDKNIRRACSQTVPNPNVPNAAFSIFAWLLKHNYSPPTGLQGNSVYENSTHKLPNPPSGYRWFEYRVYKGAATGQRIVTARNFKAVGAGYPYYTPDHYTTFRAMFLCSN